MSETQDAETRFNIIMKIAAVAAVVLTVYYVWSFFVSSRYEALCGGSYWELDKKQIDSCLDRKKELEK
ncbi:MULTISPECIES: hypothetical protein [Methylocystis]|uniref:Uncharacterized protein n=1 Tax=Methylocystis rosea TaxID=173366 RepID=A0A3G8M581_9HYPH|nr:MULTISPECIES: hypothetical protein [Methylocystis]AZG76897.1 hypothetical protein EHO51_09230 [Methylocystis rosea]ULO23576.1 hypothetical protein LNB28_15820 [Methylocystis sp. SB2]